MKREVERKKKLSPFSIDTDELNILWSRLHDQFPHGENVYSHLSINIHSDKLEFESIKELIEYHEAPASLTKFSLWISQHPRRVYLNVGMYGGNAEISATGDDVAWCAGVTEIAHSFIEGHRPWYSWFIGIPFGTLLYFTLLPIIMFITSTQVRARIPKGVAFGWLATVFAFGVLYIARKTVLPYGVVRVRDENGFIKKHTAELSLAIAILSALLTVIGWFIAK